MSPAHKGVRILPTQVAYLETDEAYAIECPQCHTRYVPLDPIAGVSVELPKGTMFAAYCPECEHGVFMRQLANPDELADAE